MPSHPQLSWSGWGDPTQATTLPQPLHRLLREALGVQPPRPAPSSPDDVALRPPRLDGDAFAALQSAVGTAHVSDDHETRVRHRAGKSTIDLLELREGCALAAPDAVVAPASHDEVLEVLRICSERRIAVVTFGGGTSVVGGVAADAEGFDAVIALDVGRLATLVALDEESRLAVLEPGLRGPEAEALLGDRGYTIGHFPQSWEYATLGGFAAARSSGQASAGYGRFDERVLALRAATPAGTIEAGRAPRSAAGPDLRQLLLGSEGTLGVVTQLSVAVSPAPEVSVYEGWTVPSFAEGTTLLRHLAQDGPAVTVLRLSDEAETAMGLARPGELGQTQPSGCLAIVGWEGAALDVRRRRAATHEVLREHGAVAAPGAGEDWAHGRYRAPYLRDALLEAGALVETLETVTFWSTLPRLYARVSAAVREALAGQGTPAVILCHISHVYASGASLYFTVACAQLDDPIRRWQRAKTAANRAILAAGASISHHHGIGRDHREAYAEEVGPLALAALRAMKRTLDPAGILNPGVLVG